MRYICSLIFFFKKNKFKNFIDLHCIYSSSPHLFPLLPPMFSTPHGHFHGLYYFIFTHIHSCGVFAMFLVCIHIFRGEQCLRRLNVPLPGDIVYKFHFILFFHPMLNFNSVKVCSVVILVFFSFF